MSDDLLAQLMDLARGLHRLDRYQEVPGVGMEKDLLGQWVKRSDVLALVDFVLRPKEVTSG